MVAEKTNAPPPVPLKPRKLQLSVVNSENLATTKPSLLVTTKPSHHPPLPARKNSIEPEKTRSSPPWSEVIVDREAVNRKGPFYEHRINIPRSHRNITCISTTSQPMLLLGGQCGLELMDFDTGETVSTISLGNDLPAYLWPCGNNLVLASCQSGALVILDCSNWQIRKCKVFSIGSCVKWMYSGPLNSVIAINAGGKAQEMIIDRNELVEMNEITGSVMIPNLKVSYNNMHNTMWAVNDKVIEVQRLNNRELSVVARFDFELDLQIGNIGRIADICPCGEKMVTAHEDGTIMIWNGFEGIPEGYSKVTKNKITCATNTGDSNVWLGCSNGTIIILAVNREKWTVINEFKAHQEQVVFLAFPSSLENSLRRPLVSVCNAGGIEVWDGLLKMQTIRTCLLQNINLYSKSSRLQVRICSWNVAAQKPPEDATFWQTWLQSNGQNDLIVIGLQEMIDPSSKSTNARILLTSKAASTMDIDDNPVISGSWVSAASRWLEGYRVIMQKSMVGLLLAVFLKNNLSQQLHHIAVDTIKNGLNGLHGNKGAISVRLLLDDTSYCFTNAHLAAGQDYVGARDADIANIFRSCRFPRHAHGEDLFRAGDGSSIGDHQYQVFFGDLNYRLQTSREAVKKYLMSNDTIPALLKFDQLQRQSQNQSHHLHKFIEGTITFAPTYKYDRGTDRFDSSEKQRIPAYCDRILISSQVGEMGSKDHVEIVNYESINCIKISDHRPIAATLLFPVRKIDQIQKETVRLNIVQSWLASLQ